MYCIIVTLFHLYNICITFAVHLQRINTALTQHLQHFYVNVVH